MHDIFVLVIAISLVASLSGRESYSAEAKIIVDLELVLMADASGSIDQAEILFQR